MKWNPFSRPSKSSASSDAPTDDAQKNNRDSSAESDLLMGQDPKKLSFLQRMALKQLQKMSPQEQRKYIEKMMTPKNIAKHAGEIKMQLEQLRKAGQITEQQYQIARRRFGV